MSTVKHPSENYESLKKLIALYEFHAKAVPGVTVNKVLANLKNALEPAEKLAGGDK